MQRYRVEGRGKPEATSVLGPGRPWHRAAAVLAAGLLATACGAGGREEMATLRRDAIAGMLGSIAADSVVRLTSGDTVMQLRGRLGHYSHAN